MVETIQGNWQNGICIEGVETDADGNIFLVTNGSIICDGLKQIVSNTSVNQKKSDAFNFAKIIGERVADEVYRVIS
jgi:hypothetical protein